MSIPNSSPELAVDGNVRTGWQGMVYFPTGETAEWGLLNVNLGSHFTVHAVRIITRVGGRNLIGLYIARFGWLAGTRWQFDLGGIEW